MYADPRTVEEIRAEVLKAKLTLPDVFERLRSEMITGLQSINEVKTLMLANKASQEQEQFMERFHRSEETEKFYATIETIYAAIQQQEDIILQVRNRLSMYETILIFFTLSLLRATLRL